MSSRVAESPTPDTAALTRVATSAAALTTPEAFAAKLAEWQQHFNVLTPFSTFSALAPGWGISGTIVQISPDARPDGPREVYAGLPFLKNGEVAIAKKGLRKLAEGAGISTQTYEQPTGARFHWKVKAVATYRGIDGTPITREATKEWDLRDGSPQIRGWKADQIQEGRKHGLRNCEARAINAAIRECGCGIDQKYTVEQLKKPFIAIRVSFQPDMQDPEVKRIVTASAMQATSALYGGAAGLVGAGPVRAIPDDEDDHVLEGRTVPGTVTGAATTSGSVPPATTSGGAAAVDPEQPPTPDAVRIVKIDTTAGKSQKTGRPWTRYSIIDSRGADHSTFDKGLADAAEQFRVSRAWVEITEEQDGQYRNLVEIVPAGQQAGLFDGQDGGY